MRKVDPITEGMYMVETLAAEGRSGMKVDYKYLSGRMAKVRSEMWLINKFLIEAYKEISKGEGPSDGLLFDIRLMQAQIYQLSHFTEQIYVCAVNRFNRLEQGLKEADDGKDSK